MRGQTLVVARIVALQQGHAKRFFGAEVVIERPLRHIGGFQQLAQPHPGKPAVHAQPLAGRQEMFACIVFSMLIHVVNVVDQSV